MLETTLEEAKCGNTHVYFVDASHFLYGNCGGKFWCKKRIFVPTAPGRERLNLLGAMNAVTFEVVQIECVETINSWSMNELFEKLRHKHGKDCIKLFLDNASYHRSYITRYAASFKEIELLFLPPYSPQLNLIERLWKFIKGKCVNGKYYQTFNGFSEGIRKCIEECHLKWDQELSSLLRWKFQDFFEIKKAFAP